MINTKYASLSCESLCLWFGLDLVIGTLDHRPWTSFRLLHVNMTSIISIIRSISMK